MSFSGRLTPDFSHLIPDPPKKKAPVRVERKTTIHLGGTSVQVGELKSILEEFPDNATLVVSYMAGDPRDVRESSSATFTINLPKP